MLDQLARPKGFEPVYSEFVVTLPQELIKTSTVRLPPKAVQVCWFCARFPCAWVG